MSAVTSEVSSLLEDLYRTEQRLKELTGGEVDTITDCDGRTFLLRHAQEQLRHSEAVRQADILDALRASELRFRQMAENIRDVFFLIDLDSSHTWYVSPAYEQIWGCTCESLYADPKSWMDSIHPDDVPHVWMTLERGGRNGFDCEFRIIRPDGELRWIRMRGFPIPNDDGDPYRTAGVASDITESKQALHALHESERRFSDVLGDVEMVSLMLDTNARITWCNDYLLRLTGWRREELIGEDWFQRFIPTASNDAQDNFAALLADVSSARHYENEILTRSGETRLIQWNNTLLRSTTGEVIGAASIGMDITERRQTETRLRLQGVALTAAETQLRQAYKMEAVGQLAGGVAHEFNNLLQALMSMAAIIRLRAHSAEIATIGSEMEVQIRHGASLTQQLLVFSRRQAIEKSDLDLGEQVAKANVFLRRLIPENIAIVVETLTGRMTVEGDEGQIQQVLLNLAINSRDAMPAGGTLTLRAGSVLNEAFLEVEDTGQGMDETTRAHLFEPFFTTKETGKGTGLGLAVVYGIIEQHGGRIEVHSRPGEGSRFRVILPAVFSDRVLVSPPKVAAELSRGGGRVLLVEDDSAVRAGITELLQMIGHEVIAVASGEEAIAIALEPSPDVLLTDVTLPGIAGSALGERLRERWPALKVVLMSGYFEEKARVDASGRGWHFLQKPFELADLAALLGAPLNDCPSIGRDGQGSTAS